MKVKTEFYNGLFYAAFAFFTAFVCTSCSEDVTNTDENKAGTTSITFNLEGEAKTRAQNGIDFSKFEVKLYMFSAQKGTTTNGSLESYTYDQTRNVERSLFTVDNIDITKNYIYVFVAYEKAYATQAVVKVWDGSINGDLAQNTSLYTHCNIQVMDEANYSSSLPVYSKPAGAEDDFMIYGAGLHLPSLTDFYTPVSVVLTRQLGAVEFRGKLGTSASCSVFSEYYHLYLSQMVENGKDGRGTQNYPGDYSVMGLLPFLSKDFSGVSSYIIYLPCTTTHSESELANHPLEYANTEREETYGSAIETSITIDGTKYSTKEKFPIFPDRKTILTMDDGTLLRVSFSGTSGNGVDLEEDWNGM